MTQRTAAKHVQTTDESSQGFSLADEADGLRAWTSDELFQELLTRSADDAPALRRMQEDILKALVAASF